MREGKQNKPPIENNKIKDKDSLKNQKGFTTMKKNADVMNARFTLDFVSKEIVGTKASFDKASKGLGPIYEELAAKMAAHPDYKIKIVAPKSSKERQVYKGMDIRFMRDYLAAIKDTYASTFDKIVDFNKKNDNSVYPIAKKNFLKHFTKTIDGKATINFKFDEAKQIVEAYRMGIPYPLTKTNTPSASSSDEDNSFDMAS